MNKVESDRGRLTKSTLNPQKHNPQSSSIHRQTHTCKRTHMHQVGAGNEEERNLKGRKVGAVRVVHSSGDLESGCERSRLRLHCLWEAKVAALPSLCLARWRLESSSSGRFPATPILTLPTSLFLPQPSLVQEHHTHTRALAAPSPHPGLLTNGDLLPFPTTLALFLCPGLLSPHPKPSCHGPR